MFLSYLALSFLSLSFLAGIHLCLWMGDFSVRLGAFCHVEDHYRRALFRAAVKDQVERRIYQMAAALGVPVGRRLSPHSTPKNTPPPTPRPAAAAVHFD